MTKRLSFSALGVALLSLAACAGYPGATANSGSSGVAASGVGISSPTLTQHCPADATDLSGQAWRPGEYCLPGGRK